MPQWQYRKISLSDLPQWTDELELLNEAGEEGWELVNVTTNNIALLKRPLVAPIGPSASSAASAPLKQTVEVSRRRKKTANPN